MGNTAPMGGKAIDFSGLEIAPGADAPLEQQIAYSNRQAAEQSQRYGESILVATPSEIERFDLQPGPQGDFLYREADLQPLRDQLLQERADEAKLSADRQEALNQLADERITGQSSAQQGQQPVQRRGRRGGSRRGQFAPGSTVGGGSSLLGL